MRKYLFKAKCKDNNEWVEGFYYESSISGCYILSPKIEARKRDRLVVRDAFDVYEVIPDTVREYIGRTDDDGNKIFEGDILNANIDGMYDWHKGYVQYKHSQYKLNIYYDPIYSEIRQQAPQPPDLINIPVQCQIIGNIYDSPNLIREDKTTEDLL